MYYLPEAALILGVPLSFLRYMLYQSPYRPVLERRYRRHGKNWRLHRILLRPDLDCLARVMADRLVLTPRVGRPPSRVWARVK